MITQTRRRKRKETSHKILAQSLLTFTEINEVLWKIFKADNTTKSNHAQRLKPNKTATVSYVTLNCVYEHQSRWKQQLECIFCLCTHCQQDTLYKRL